MIPKQSEKLFVYGDECLSRLTIYEWFKRLKEGREDLSDDELSIIPRIYLIWLRTISICS